MDLTQPLGQVQIQSEGECHERRPTAFGLRAEEEFFRFEIGFASDFVLRLSSFR